MDPTLSKIIVKDSFLDSDSLIKSVKLTGFSEQSPTSSPISANIIIDNVDKFIIKPETTSLELIQLLNTSKDQFAHPRFEISRREANPFENLGNSVFINRAAVKLANVDAIFNFTGLTGGFPTGLVKVGLDNTNGFTYENSDFTYADLAGAPGGFIEYIQYRRPNSKGYAISLSSENGGLKYKSSKLNLSPQRLEIFMGDNGTGDLYTESVNFANYVIKKHDPRGLDLVTADGGFDIGDTDYDKEEQLLARLVLSEILAAFKLLKTGGHMMIKLLGSNSEFMYQLIMLVALSFDDIYIFKPISSRPANSETYLVALSKKPRDVTLVYEQIMEEAWRKYPNNNNSIITNLIDYDRNDPWVVKFTNWLRYNNFLLTRQELYYVNNTNKYIRNEEITYPLLSLYNAFIFWNIPDNVYHPASNSMSYMERKIINNLPNDISLQPLTNNIVNNRQPTVTNSHVSTIHTITLEEEYKRWLDYQAIWNAMWQFASKNNQLKYDITNIMVRFMLWWINFPGEYIVARDNAIEEFNNKGLKLTGCDFNRLMSLRSNIRPNYSKIQVNIQNGMVNYAAFSFKMNKFSLTKMLKSYNDHSHLVQTLLRYNSLQPTNGNFWSITPHVFEHLKVLGVEYEAFANPMAYNLPKFFSPFPELDNVYGSLGSFFETELPSGVYEVNPPYTNDFLLVTTNRMLQALQSDKKYTFYVVYPSWTEAEGTKLIETSDYIKHRMTLHNHYLYDTINDTNIRAVFINTLYVLSNDEMLNIDFDELVQTFYK